MPRDLKSQVSHSQLEVEVQGKKRDKHGFATHSATPWLLYHPMATLQSAKVVLFPTVGSVSTVCLNNTC